MKLSVSGTWFNLVIFLVFAAVLACRAAGGSIPLNAFTSGNIAEAAGLGVLCLIVLFFAISVVQIGVAYLKAWTIGVPERFRRARRFS